MPGRAFPAEQGGDRGQRRDQHLAIPRRQPRHPFGDDGAHAGVEAGEDLAARGGGADRPMPGILAAAPRDPALALEAAQDAADIAGVEPSSACSSVASGASRVAIS